MSALLVVVVMLGQAPQLQGEVVLFPAAVQLNGKFTQTVGTFGTVSWRAREGLSLQVFGGGNWFARETSFNDELFSKWRQEIRPANVLPTWALMLGVELEPFAGTLALFGDDVRFSLTLGAGLGGGGTAVRFYVSGGDSYADAGARFMGMVSSGLRVAVGRHLVLRAEIRDVMYGTRSTTINGCTLADAQVFDQAIVAAREPGPYSAGCVRLVGPEAKQAVAVLREQGEVAVNVGAYVGVGVVF